MIRRDGVTNRDEYGYEEMVLFGALAYDLGVNLFEVSNVFAGF